MPDKGGGGKGGNDGKLLELVLCSAGIFVCYFYFSIAQHDIYLTQDDGTKFSHTSLQLFVMICANVVGAVVANVLLSRLMGTSSSLSNSPSVFSLSQITNPYSWLSIGLCFYGAMDASNRSLSSLPYPIMVLGKSCKMVPVMFAGILINGTKYKWTKYVSVFTVTAGIVIVNFYKGKGDNKKTELVPLLLLVVSLALDAIVGPRQEYHRDACRKKGVQLSPWETMFKTNLAGLVWVRICDGAFHDGMGERETDGCICVDTCWACLYFRLGSCVSSLVALRRVWNTLLPTRTCTSPSRCLLSSRCLAKFSSFTPLLRSVLDVIYFCRHMFIRAS